MFGNNVFLCGHDLVSGSQSLHLRNGIWEINRFRQRNPAGINPAGGV
nr:MAG TPA: hypothetical protein [Caudoviricetes sp.]